MSDDLRPRSDRRTTDAHDHDVLDPLYVGIVTVSSTRGPEHDPGGDMAQELVEEANHEVTAREHVSDDFSAIQGTVIRLANRETVDCIVTTGGTGMTIDDVTPTACQGLFDRTIPGFGEQFRSLSWEEIGHRAIASRATAGVISTTPTFCVPGSSNAVRTAMMKLILPEAPHLAGLSTRHLRATEE